MAQDAHPYIYADNAATTPLSPVALDAMMPYLTSEFGNPSGIHRVASTAARALADAREHMTDPAASAPSTCERASPSRRSSPAGRKNAASARVRKT